MSPHDDKRIQQASASGGRKRAAPGSECRNKPPRKYLKSEHVAEADSGRLKVISSKPSSGSSSSKPGSSKPRSNSSTKPSSNSSSKPSSGSSSSKPGSSKPSSNSSNKPSSKPSISSSKRSSNSSSKRGEAKGTGPTTTKPGKEKAKAQGTGTIDDIFSGVKRLKEEKKEEEAERVAKKKKMKEEHKRRQANPFTGEGGSAKRWGWADEVKPVRFDDEGLPIYTWESLRIGQGGGTELCPFDCDCCF
eukprot:jgi/Undpi1/1282/HiC_scaffold_11.g04674.m1